MQGMHLYEYAVIRVVPSVEREEFLNIGVILFSKRAKFIHILYHIDKEKITHFSRDVDFDLLQSNLDSFSKIAKGDKEGGVIAGMDIPERFRWLTAMKSACIQTSRPHSGFSGDLLKTTEKLFEELVL